MVFSDSKVFLERVKVLPVIVLDGKVGHISFTENTHEVAMKTFVDFYAISKASRVIRILAPEMYNTVFSYYAAVLGGSFLKNYTFSKLLYTLKVCWAM